MLLFDVKFSELTVENLEKMLVKGVSLSRVASLQPTTLLAKKCTSHSYFSRFLTTNVECLFCRTFYSTASAETYLFTRAKKKRN